MTPKEKAIEITDKFKDHVNPYIGSGMLSNTHDDSAILWQSKKCAVILVDTLLQYLRDVQFNYHVELSETNKRYWQEVRLEIEKL